MILCWMLQSRADEECPIRVGLIRAGKIGSMYLAQTRTTRSGREGNACKLLREQANRGFGVSDRLSRPDERTSFLTKTISNETRAGKRRGLSTANQCPYVFRGAAGNGCFIQRPFFARRGHCGNDGAGTRLSGGLVVLPGAIPVASNNGQPPHRRRARGDRPPSLPASI